MKIIINLQIYYLTIKLVSPCIADSYYNVIRKYDVGRSLLFRLYFKVRPKKDAFRHPLFNYRIKDLTTKYIAIEHPKMTCGFAQLKKYFTCFMLYILD